MAGLDIKGVRAKVSRDYNQSKTLYKISVSDGKTTSDILINIYKNGNLSTIINFHADNELQYRMALDVVNHTILYRTESIIALVNKLKRLKTIQFYEI